VDEDDLDKIDEEVERLIDESVDEAKAGADPSEDRLLTDVYVSY
jgi:TPP-dependent pyruvate/acetoin dehydrogenase alpha subunit